MNEKYPKALIMAKPSKTIPGEIGLFALRDLKKGTIIHTASHGGEKFFSKSLYNKLDKITKKMVGHYCTGVYDGFYSIPNINYSTIHIFCNHSCEPYVGFDKSGNTILIRNIKSGEEITIDYGFMITDPSYKLKCLCGSKKCRKMVTGNDWKNPEYVKKNKKYMNI